jgi:hypothetical protein
MVRLSIIAVVVALAGCTPYVRTQYDHSYAACLVAPYNLPAPYIARGSVAEANGDGVHNQHTQQVTLVPNPKDGDYTLVHEVAHYVDTRVNGLHPRWEAHRYSWQDIYHEMVARMPACAPAPGLAAVVIEQGRRL